jgi:integrase
VAEHLEVWLRNHAGVRVRRRTLEGYRANVQRYVVPRIGRIPLQRLTAGHVQEMESWLLREGGARRQGLSPVTVLQVHRILSGSLRWAVRLGLVGRNVVESVDPPRAVRKEVRFLEWLEVHRFLEEISDPLYQCLVLVDVQTGLRQSELLGLQWRDIDLAARALSVRRAWIKLPSGTMDLTAPKGGCERVLDLPAESVDALRAWRSGSDGNGDFVFCHSDGSPLDPDAVTQGFKRMATRAGLGYLRFHDLRHTHASLMLSQGVHLKIVSERLGHSSIAVTGDLYSHVQPTVQREAVERFGVAWSAGMVN